METCQEIKKRILLALLVSLAFTISLANIKLLKTDTLFGLFLAFAIIATCLFPSSLKKRKMTFTKQMLTVFICITILAGVRLAVENTTEKIEKVLTCSMTHAQENFDEWWMFNSYKYRNISKEQFKSFPFPDGFGMLQGGEEKISPEKIEIGNVIIFKTPKSEKTSHRVIREFHANNAFFFETIGDNNGESETVAVQNISGKMSQPSTLRKLHAAMLSLIFYNPCDWKVKLETPGLDEQFCFDKRQAFCTKEQNECCNASDDKKQICIKNYAEASNDPKNCCLIDETILFRSLCYYQFALQQDNESLCSFIRVYFPDGTNCWKINSKECSKAFDLKDDCYLGVAKDEKDEQICRQIYDARKRQECNRLTSQN